jgi:Spy/CpxP family protein refolding chaperone
MTHVRQVAGALVGLLAFVTIAAAQTPRQGPPGDRSGSRPAGDHDDEVRQAMEQMVVARMKEALRLSEEQQAKVIPRVQELMKARQEHAARRRAALDRLRGLLQDETAGDDEIGRALRDVRTLEDDFRGREESLRAAIDRDLTPRQQARMVFFEPRLRRAMQRRIQEAMGADRGPGPRRGPGPPPARRPGRPGPPVEESPGDSDAPEDEL